MQPLSQDKNNLKSDVKYAACGTCQRGLWELGHSDIKEQVRNQQSILAKEGEKTGLSWRDKSHISVNALYFLCCLT